MVCWEEKKLKVGRPKTEVGIMKDGRMEEWKNGRGGVGKGGSGN